MKKRNKRGTKQSKPSTDDILKIVMLQLMKNNKQQPTRTNPLEEKIIYGTQENNREEISKLKDTIITELQNRNAAISRVPLLMGTDSKNDDEVLDLIDKADRDPRAAYKLAKIAPKLKNYYNEAFEEGKSELLVELSDARNEIERIAKQKDDFENEFIRMNDEQNELMERLSLIHIDNDNKTKQNEKLIISINKMNDELTTRKNEMKNINDLMQKKQIAIEKNEKKIMDYESEIKKLYDDIIKHKNDANVTKEDLDKIKSEKKHYESMLELTRKTNDELKDSNDELSIKFENLRPKYKDAKRKIAILENNFDKIVAISEEGKKEIEEQKQTIKGYEKDAGELVKNLPTYEDIEKHIKLMNRETPDKYESFKNEADKNFNALFEEYNGVKSINLFLKKINSDLGLKNRKLTHDYIQNISYRLVANSKYKLGDKYESIKDIKKAYSDWVNDDGDDEEEEEINFEPRRSSRIYQATLAREASDEVEKRRSKKK